MLFCNREWAEWCTSKRMIFVVTTSVWVICLHLKCGNFFCYLKVYSVTSMASNDCLNLPKILLLWKFSFLIFSSWLGCRGPNNEVEVWSQNNQYIQMVLFIVMMCRSSGSYYNQTCIMFTNKEMFDLFWADWWPRLVSRLSTPANSTTDIPTRFQSEITLILERNLIKPGVKSYKHMEQHMTRWTATNQTIDIQ